MISKLNIQGVEIVNEELIKDEAVDFFFRLYAKDDMDRHVINNLFSNCLDGEGAKSLEMFLQKRK